MRHLKFLLVAFAITISTVVSASPAFKFNNTNSISTEIEKLIEESGYEMGGEFTVTVFFSISEDQKIQSLSVASQNEEINQFLQKKLENQELPGEYWRTGKIYEVSVVLNEW